ncbi:MAG: TldD/PmbA family protein [Pseudomonadota bacterium]
MQSLLDQTALSNLAEGLVRAAQKAGADAADAIAIRSVSIGVDIRDGAVEESERSESDDVGLRVFVGHKQAVVSTNDIARTDLAALAERAVAMARVAPDDRFAGLADSDRLARERPDLDLIDPDIPAVAELERRARLAEEAALSVKGVTKSGGASAGAGISGMVLVTSSGFHGSYLASRQSVSMMAIAGEGTGMERDYDHSSALHGSDLTAPDAIGRSAGERAVRRLNPRKVKTRAVPVIFDSRLSNTLVSHLASAANGASIARKASFVKDKLGERLFAPGIRIVDDPLRKRGLRSHPFDGEGVAVQKMIVVDDGILASWFLDTATARELGMTTTGHAARGVSAPPSPLPSNLYLEPGNLTPEQLIAETGTGFYVTDLIGMGTNLVTGDYSRGAAGFWIENGEIAYPVSEVTIAGHLLDMFRSLTPADDLAFKFVTNAPTLRVEGMTVAGQ